MMSLDKLKQVREEQNKSYQDLADAIGLTKSAYWMIENGKRGLKYSMAVRIAAALGTTPDSLFLHSELTDEEQEAAR